MWCCMRLFSTLLLQYDTLPFYGRVASEQSIPEAAEYLIHYPRQTKVINLSYLVVGRWQFY